MTESILDSTKKTLGLAESYTAFDVDVLMHINTAFSTLHQLGIGPVEGFAIEDSSVVWDDFLMGDPRYNGVKTYMFLKVRLLFDPPATSFAINAMKEQIEQLEWRLSIVREGDYYVPPVTVPDTIDGGNAG